MVEMTDEELEFINSCKDFYGALDMPDDEFIDRRREIEDAFDHGWDRTKYVCRWQDPNCKPYLVSKNELASLMNVSLKTIDDWERKGMPIYRRGDRGVAYQIDIGAFLQWSTARAWGVSIEEYRELELAEEVKAKVEDERRWAAIETKHALRKLSAEVAELGREIQTLTRK